MEPFRIRTRSIEGLSEGIKIVLPYTNMYQVSIDLRDSDNPVKSYLEDALEDIENPIWDDYNTAKHEYIRQAFEGSDLGFMQIDDLSKPTFTRIYEVFYEFHSTSLTRAQNFIVKCLPYFKKIAWTAETIRLNPFDEVTMCERDGIRLIVKEIDDAKENIV